MRPIAITIEREGRVVTVLPKPLFDQTTVDAIKQHLTEQDGWIHQAYAVDRFCKTAAEARQLADQLNKEFAAAPEANP